MRTADEIARRILTTERTRYEGQAPRDDETLARAYEEVRRERDDLRLALTFYADRKRYESMNLLNDGTDPFTSPSEPYYQDIGRDWGAVARAALRKDAP